ncbi:hypothetical protein [Kytococcus sp. Marseille-QA3725]
MTLLVVLYLVGTSLFMWLVTWAMDRSWWETIGDFWVALVITGIVTVVTGVRKLPDD